MDIKLNENVINVKGNITTISDAEKVIQFLHSLSDKDTIVLRILDGFSLPSSIIGELLKLHDMGKNIIIEIKDSVLYELLDDLNLTKIFTVKKV
jgi:hypothetical protein